VSGIVFELPKNATRVWDLPVPVVIDKEERNIKMYIRDTIDEPYNYNEMCYLLATARKGTTVELFLNTPGGIIDTAFMLADAIRSSKAKVIGHLAGTVASAGTIIAMVCDEIRTAPHLSFMIHNYSGGMQGKGNELKARQQFVDAQLNSAFKTFYSGFLTEEEMDKVIEGTDMWMGTEEVLTRWTNRVSYMKGEA
jgi:ATP-dependent protease ClpP protease subunit